MATMNGSVRLALLLAGALALPVSGQQTGTITGRLTSSDTGRPLVAAYVQAMRPDGSAAASTETNQQGAYRLTGLGAGTYTVTVSAIGFGTQSLRVVQLSADGSLTVDGSIAPRAIELNPVVVSASRQTEKALDAPSHVEVIGEQEVEARPVTTPADFLRSSAAVDIITQGVQSTNVVIRGFNNIFSGATHVLTDNRIAGVPSLRVNVMNFIPSNMEDVERIEIVYGPGSALYGPNTANGVLHIITKSPLRHQGTVVSVSGGNQSVATAAFRTSHLLSDNVGFKLSGQYFQADEWPYKDPVEVAEAQKFASDPFWKFDLVNALSILPSEADIRIARIGARDNSLKRWSGEARLDWDASDELSTVFSVGTSNSSQIELTGLGAGQADGWTYTYAQAKATWKQLFAQVYLNASDAGDTYLLRNGAPIVDKSKLWVGEIQNRTAFGNRQSFTYGVDLLRTLPETEGTINGIYEDHDETTEVGGYVQSETVLNPKLDLVLAARLDHHSALPDPIFSPRAALVLKPSENQRFRLTFNRAFSTPTSLNRYLDLPTAVPNPDLARLGYSVRVQGTGNDGFTFRQANGGYVMRSPFTQGSSTTLVPADVTPYWGRAITVVAAQAAQAGIPVDPFLQQYLGSLAPTSADIGTNFLNTTNNTGGSIADLDLPKIDPIREETSTTLEAGYQGILGSKVLLAADVWYSRRENLVTPLTTQTPLLLLNPQQTGAYLTGHFVQDLNMSVEAATALATQLATFLAKVPLGVISSPDVNASGAQLLATYANVDKSINLWGVDLTGTLLLSDQWSASASTSIVNDAVFDYVVGSDTTQVTLNAPKFKAAGTLAYNDRAGSGLSGEARLRYTDRFPASSGVYQGTRCILPGTTPAAVDIEDCVDSYALVDVLLGYALPFSPGVSIDLGVQNLFNEGYRSFPGVPSVGRMAMLRLRYDFGK